MRVLTLPLLIACVTGACTVSTNGGSGAASDALPPSSASVTPATPPPMEPDATRYDCDDSRVVQVGYGDPDATPKMDRSARRRVGKECDMTVRPRWLPKQ